MPPQDAKAFEVAAGHFFRIVSVEGPQVGDLNLWNAHDLTERFYSGKTRALHLNRALVTASTRGWRPGRGRSRNPSTQIRQLEPNNFSR